MDNLKFTNSLVNETSPYLLQHAHNPVNWVPWTTACFEQAKHENKLLLVSIGYSACHWCHVMEKECFEDEEIAEFMNRHFINIKIDREERPDLDQVYMSAVQLMTGQGGWPLNCFLLPDGRPIYGGTYFPKPKWLQLLNHLVHLHTQQPDKTNEYAAELMNGLLKMEIIQLSGKQTQSHQLALTSSINRWKLLLDEEYGGMQKAPKFPLPNNYLFLMRFAYLCSDEKLLKHVHLTLEKMAFGGIYDQLGGGFARYSVDEKWKVPHFEKMLYDNAQLISLYAEAWQQSKNNLYKEVVEETIEFVITNFKSVEGGYFSALDADSEGKEGCYYVWTEDELKQLLDDKSYPIFLDYYNVNELGYWEEEQYILMRKKSVKEIAFQFQETETEILRIIKNAKTKLKQHRNTRVKPGLDDKQLCSWNALLLKAFSDAYRVFDNIEYLNEALALARFIKLNYKNGNGLYHTHKNGISKINGFLEDYAFVIEAYISLYESSGEEEWLTEAKRLTEYVVLKFHDSQTGYFYFTSADDPELIVRKIDLSDNVLPASNSQMARNLFRLSKHIGMTEYQDMAKRMLGGILEDMIHYGSAYSNWGILLLELAYPFYEIVLTGVEQHIQFKQVNEHYLPNSLLVRAFKPSEWPLIKNRYVENKTLIYVCKDSTCSLPTEEFHPPLIN